MNTETAVIFENVTKFYNSYNLLTAGLKNFLFRFPKSLNNFRKKITVLENISLKITKGESVGIIGRNGAGKSTMLGLIAGTLKPNSGRVIVKQRVSPLLELGAGFHPDLNGRENIILNGVLLGLRRKEVIKKLDQIIEFSELNEFVDYPLRTYSSGMVARLGFSIVAHLEPELLLIDEILAVGDVNFQKKCLDKLN
ncbi:MAG: ABC transporter ATP-binding protein, partial [Leptospiraceae bacterium]|nr:ABC transporter ATP-binding protein [Leptospiraceae bacterium]